MALNGDGPPIAARLYLLDGFSFWLDDKQIELGLNSQRLLALLALHERPLERWYVATTLWGEHGDERSAANLRTSLARLPRWSERVVQPAGRQLSLPAWVSVDVREASRLIHRIMDRDSDVLSLPGIHRRFMVDLLPGWYEDWVVTENERYRELRLHALEILCEAFTAANKFGAAIEAGLGAVAAEPLRESAQRALIRAHLAEGNQVAAVHQYQRYRSLLDQELGLAPSASLTALIPTGR